MVYKQSNEYEVFLIFLSELPLIASRLDWNEPSLTFLSVDVQWCYSTSSLLHWSSPFPSSTCGCKLPN